MNLLSVDHLGIRVCNPKVSVSFYASLGFDLTRWDEHENVVVLKHPSGVEINLLDTATPDIPVLNVLMDTDTKHPGYTHVAIRVADIEEALQTLSDLGIAVTEGPVTFGDGKTSIFVRDPDRNVIEFTQHPQG